MRESPRGRVSRSMGRACARPLARDPLRRGSAWGRVPRVCARANASRRASVCAAAGQSRRGRGRLLRGKRRMRRCCGQSGARGRCSAPSKRIGDPERSTGCRRIRRTSRATDQGWVQRGCCALDRQVTVATTSRTSGASTSANSGLAWITLQAPYRGSNEHGCTETTRRAAATATTWRTLRGERGARQRQDRGCHVGNRQFADGGVLLSYAQTQNDDLGVGGGRDSGVDGLTGISTAAMATRTTSAVATSQAGARGDCRAARSVGRRSGHRRRRAASATREAAIEKPGRRRRRNPGTRRCRHVGDEDAAEGQVAEGIDETADEGQGDEQGRERPWRLLASESGTRV